MGGASKINTESITAREPKVEKSTIKIPSLSDIKNNLGKSDAKQVEKINTDATDKNIASDSFSLQQLNKLWNAYAEDFKKDGKQNEYLILANRTLEVDENYRIKLKLDNLIQVDQLNEIRIDFLDYLRKGLKNKNIAIDAIVVEASAEKKMYTSREKLAYLKEKYPMVEELQKRLGLETDF